MKKEFYSSSNLQKLNDMIVTAYLQPRKAGKIIAKLNKEKSHEQD